MEFYCPGTIADVFGLLVPHGGCKHCVIDTGNKICSASCENLSKKQKHIVGSGVWDTAGHCVSVRRPWPRIRDFQRDNFPDCMWDCHGNPQSQLSSIYILVGDWKCHD